MLEGLELRRVGGSLGKVENRFPELLVARDGGELHIANCRLVLGLKLPQIGGSPGVLLNTNVAALSLRNCELHGNVTSSGWYCRSGGRSSIENCVITVGSIGFHCAGGDIRDVSLHVCGNTIVGDCLYLTLWSKPNLPEKMQAAPPIHLEFSRNVTHWDRAFRKQGLLFLHQYQLKPPFSVVEAQELLPRLVQLTEKQNVYLSGTHMLRFATDWKVMEGTGCRNLSEWNQFWAQQNTGSVEGDVRFQGGDLLLRGRTAPEKLSPEDFRLRPDSSGYRAGKDGKDLGADVDLVGPGKAYEKWKQTPEYQKWLQETGQLKTEQPEDQPFVVMGGKGVEVRKYQSLAEAVQAASDGDTIEIRGNGPFVSEPINIEKNALVIRAGDGFRPVIRLKAQSWEQTSGTWTACIKTNAPLVLEGLELRRFDPPPKMEVFRHFLSSSSAPLHVANCRFLTPHESCIHVFRSPRCVVRNCELLNGDAFAVVGSQTSGGLWIIDNCLQAAMISLKYSSEAPNPQGGSIQLTRNSSAAIHGVWHDLAKVSGLPDAGQNFKPIRLVVSDSILAADTALLFNQYDPSFFKAPLLEPAEAEAVLVDLLDWQGRGNLYGDHLLRWCVGAKPLPPHGPKTLDDWKQFWNSGETGSLQGQVRFQGGDVLARLATAPEKIVPEDFRLRPDSPGYRAGPNGKDLGADIDLVGPGRAYEKWKQTPEYQQWLKDTGQP